MGMTTPDAAGGANATDAPAPDLARLESLQKLLGGNVAGFMITLMASLGDRLGLFKTLTAAGPATSAELADRAGIQERYAREWLGAMACGRYVEYDPASARFSLSPEQMCLLADEGGPYFVGGTFQVVPTMAGVLDLVAQAFRAGGGVPQSAYDPALWDGMMRSHAPWFAHSLVQRALPELPEVRAQLERGAEVADVGCGSGGALIRLAQEFPNARYTGYDAFAPTIARATANSAAAGVAARVRFEQCDAAQGLPEQFDVITSFDVVHDAADPLGVLRAIHAGLAPGGIYVCLEPRCFERLEDNFGLHGAYLHSMSTLYCMTTSLAQGGAGLGTAGLPEPTLRALCAEAGFSAMRRVPLADAFGHEDTINALFEVRA